MRFEVAGDNKIKDNHTGTVYSGRVDYRFLETLNALDESREHHKSRRVEVSKENGLLRDVVQGVLSFLELKYGVWNDE